MMRMEPRVVQGGASLPIMVEPVRIRDSSRLVSLAASFFVDFVRFVVIAMCRRHGDQ
jgi:hypothetical protein